MQAIDTERSPGLPSLMVTTRRRLMPHGTSCSFLQAVTQALHSMQRSASQRNFIRGMVPPPSRCSDLAIDGLDILNPSEVAEHMIPPRVHILSLRAALPTSPPEHDMISAGG